MNTRSVRENTMPRFHARDGCETLIDFDFLETWILTYRQFLTASAR